MPKITFFNEVCSHIRCHKPNKKALYGPQITGDWENAKMHNISNSESINCHTFAKYSGKWHDMINLHMISVFYVVNQNCAMVWGMAKAPEKVKSGDTPFWFWVKTSCSGHTKDKSMMTKLTSWENSKINDMCDSKSEKQIWIPILSKYQPW